MSHLQQGAKMMLDRWGPASHSFLDDGDYFLLDRVLPLGHPAVSVSHPKPGRRRRLQPNNRPPAVAAADRADWDNMFAYGAMVLL